MFWTLQREIQRMISPAAIVKRSQALLREREARLRYECHRLRCCRRCFYAGAQLVGPTGLGLEIDPQSGVLGFGCQNELMRPNCNKLRLNRTSVESF